VQELPRTIWKPPLADDIKLKNYSNYTNMQIGLIGLGKMGFNLALNMHRHGHDVRAFDVHQPTVDSISKEGIATAGSVRQLVESLSGRKVVWLMIPAGSAVDSLIREVKPLLREKD